VLRIPRLGFTAPVFEGTDDLTLNRGLGRIGGTATIGEPGNIGIAGHRDGFFRVLKDVARGELIELNTPDGRQDYVVDRIAVVDPMDVEVLRPRSSRQLTLITCYPFYFVGDAPYRYVVQASLMDANYKLD
jgi:sortase A